MFLRVLLSYIFFLVFLMSLGSCSKEDIIIEDTFMDYHDTSLPIGGESKSFEQWTMVGDDSMRIKGWNVFDKSASIRPVLRIPSLVFTDKGTALVAVENRAASWDKGQMDILVARKEFYDTLWSSRLVIPYDSIRNRRSMNPAFLIDKFGTHGPKGRIYLFVAHMSNDEGALSNNSTQLDIVYKYSDDDGQSWSDETSLKNRWNMSEYSGAFPSPSNGIQLLDGTFILPTMIVKDENYRSGLLIKRPGRDWIFSRISPNKGDNECCVYIDRNDKLILDCRTTDYVRRKYVYDMEADSFSQIPLEVPVYHNLKAEITWVESLNKYLTIYVDVKKDSRENPTLYASSDAISWDKICRLQDGPNGYSYANISVYENIIYAVLEDNQSQSVKVFDLTFLNDKLR